ncbi:MAG: LysR family transcriptional regulator [Sphingorhabdus sp.]
MRLPDFEAWGIFACVVEQKSFTGAASMLGLSKATISKAVTRLESQLGAPLFHRTSRRLALTESGSKLLEHARRILAEGEAAEEAAREDAVEPVGLVRLAAPMSFGLSHVAPAIADFLSIYPGISVDLHLSDARVDLIGEGFDIALRVGALPDSSLRARRLCPVRLMVIASPAYLETHGTPSHPAQLAEHKCIRYSLSARPETWTFTNSSQQQVSVQVAGQLSVNNGDAMIATLCGGLGIGQLPDFLCMPHVESGRLVEILADWASPPSALHLLTPPGRIRPLRVTALIEFLVQRLDPTGRRASGIA